VLGQLVLVDVDEPVWRVGYTPDPWAWSGWEWAVGGRFHGRWDDHAGNFRTVYAGSTLLGCLLEVLACLRPDPTLVDELSAIVEEDTDEALHPTAPAGAVAYDWLSTRLVGSATLRGRMCAVTAAETIAALRPQFIGIALAMGLKDFDAAALKDGRPRELTQRVATYLHDTTDTSGVGFASRLGDDLALWAIFERAGDPEVSPALVDRDHASLTADHPDLVEAFRLLGLRWAD
jgi:hypothetical protein